MQENDVPAIQLGASFWIGVVVAVAIAVLVIVAGWKMFTKAGKPGWAIIIPFYNVYTILKIAGRPGWWLVLYIIPVVNIVIGIMVMVDLAKSFGKGGAFGFFGLYLFSFVGYPILGFGQARYLGPAASGGAPQQPQHPDSPYPTFGS